jgi:hypothetical protein
MIIITQDKIARKLCLGLQLREVSIPVTIHGICRKLLNVQKSRRNIPFFCVAAKRHREVGKSILIGWYYLYISCGLIVQFVFAAKTQVFTAKLSEKLRFNCDKKATLSLTPSLHVENIYLNFKPLFPI